MSERNTGLFVAGHVAPARLAEVIWSWPGFVEGDLRGEETPRWAHGRRQDHAFTLVALRLFEVGGLLTLDQAEPPGEDDLEVYLGGQLSRPGAAVYLHYDEERGAGGHALFQDGALVSRRVYDGRQYQPVVRDLRGEQPLRVSDEEAWIWADIAAAVEQGATPVLGAGVRTDDDLASLIGGLSLQVLGAPRGAPSRPPGGTGGGERRAGGLRGLLRRLASDEAP